MQLKADVVGRNLPAVKSFKLAMNQIQSRVFGADDLPRAGASFWSHRPRYRSRKVRHHTPNKSWSGHDLRSGWEERLLYHRQGKALQPHRTMAERTRESISEPQHRLHLVTSNADGSESMIERIATEPVNAKWLSRLSRTMITAINGLRAS
jgi:hypothetical protein